MICFYGKISFFGDGQSHIFGELNGIRFIYVHAGCIYVRGPQQMDWVPRIEVTKVMKELDWNNLSSLGMISKSEYHTFKNCFMEGMELDIL